VTTRDATLFDDATPVACAICGATETRTLWAKYGYAIGQCVQCALVYANPRAPHAKILHRYNEQYFWHEYLPSLGVVDGQFDLAAFDARYAALLTMIAAAVPQRGRLLEVGCGAGFFLKSAQRAGWDVEGIELSQYASAFAIDRLQLPIRREPAESSSIAPESCAVAAMFDVIEHLFDPRSVLSAIARALAPQGMLVISTPNIESISSYLLGIDWAVLSPLEHVYYFSEDSLRRLLEATGFTDVRFVRTFVNWGPQETVNFAYTHDRHGWRSRATEVLIRGGGMPLARLIQRAGRQDALLCFARKR
jgi:SAM-dependent methyltransferase